MNWPVTESAQGWLDDLRADRWEHVQADPSTAYCTLGENDSFGPVDRYVVCRACAKSAREQEAAEQVRCRDCGGRHARRDGIAWRWYDFYAEQGDEPLQICNGCATQPKHQARVARDRAAYEAEMGADA